MSIKKGDLLSNWRGYERVTLTSPKELRFRAPLKILVLKKVEGEVKVGQPCVGPLPSVPNQALVNAPGRRVISTSRLKGPCVDLSKLGPLGLLQD